MLSRNCQRLARAVPRKSTGSASLPRKVIPSLVDKNLKQNVDEKYNFNKPTINNNLNLF